MKCNSCQEEINPKFAHAIQQNVCPFCGGAILDPKLQEILISLKDVMEKAKEYQQELDDFMFSNYSYRKINNSQTKPISRATEQSEEVSEKSPFFKRSGVDPSKFKDIIMKIHSGDSTDTQDEQISDFEEPMDPTETEMLQDMIERKTPQEIELEKLKQMSTRRGLGGGGIFRRSE